MIVRIFSFSSFIIFLILSSFLPAQNINFRDSFLKEYLLISSPYNTIARNSDGNAIKIDSNGDGEISKEEALEVYSLVLSLESLLIPAERPDTQWIKNFSNLRSLTCYGSPYAKIKFDISELTQLTELYQYKVTMLYGQQPNLKILFTDQFPEHLTSGYLSFAPNLEILKCGDNQKSVTLTKLPALKELYLQGKNLSRIKLADLPALSLFDYSAKDDKNPSLFLENLPQITQLQLPTDSGLDSLVVKNLPNLKSLDIQVKSQHLMNVKNLVLEGLPMLASLNFTNRNATSQPEAPATLSAISQETGLQEEALPNTTDEKTKKITTQTPAHSSESNPLPAIEPTNNSLSVIPEQAFAAIPQKNISKLIEIDEVSTETPVIISETITEPESSEEIVNSVSDTKATNTDSDLSSIEDINQNDVFSQLLIPEEPAKQKVTMHTETKSDSSSIIIHPNIVTDTLFIKKNIAPAPFEIFDINDIKVLSGILTSNRSITLDALYEGEYTLVIYTSNGKIKESFIKN